MSESSQTKDQQKHVARIVGMGVPMDHSGSEVEKFRRHTSIHGVIALAIVMVSIFVTHGFDVRVLLFFGVPTLLAFVNSRVEKSRVSEAFLVSIGIASIVALIPSLFPRLGGFSNVEAGGHNDRLSMLYSVIYLTWIAVVLPIRFFIGDFLARLQGRPTRFSKFTCVSGMIAMGIVWPVLLSSLPKIIESVGLWPII